MVVNVIPFLKVPTCDFSPKTLLGNASFLISRSKSPMDYASGYYAVYFEDQIGNRLEVCPRLRTQEKFREMS